ncbi:MAG: NYN domain-containing protein [Betaproteobacteria bacterium]|nr:NYN domain-containing protein [Betaproteobacteria bacterium]
MPTFPIISFFGLRNIRVMTFVDGENLAIRCGAILRSDNYRLRSEAKYRKDANVWHPTLIGDSVVDQGGVMRTHYYTAVQGDHALVEAVAKELKEVGVSAPRVFKKAGGRSKRVDVSLATDMLRHAAHHNYDIAVIVSGDEDFVPLIEAVQAEGRGVHV